MSGTEEEADPRPMFLLQAVCGDSQPERFWREDARLLAVVWRPRPEQLL